MLKFAQSMLTGIRRRWRRAGTRFLSMLGSIWLFTEVLTRVSPAFTQWLDHNGTIYLIVSLSLSLVGSLFAAYESRSVVFTIPNTDTRLRLSFSDIFREEAHWIIGVNEYFDSTLGGLVSASSLHGQIITNIYKSNEAAFRQDVDNALAASGYKGEAADRVKGQSVKYPLGTTAIVQRGAHKIFLVAISNTDLETHRASSSVPILWEALGEALKQVDAHGNGEPLAMPLIGNGRASLNIPPQHLLRLIALKLVESAKKYDLPREVTINLSDDCFDHLDIVEIKRGWSVV